MNISSRPHARFLSAAVISLSTIFAAPAFASSLSVDTTTIRQLAVNGGADTAEPGVTCIQLTVAPVASCQGWIAIKNDNKSLTAAALTSRATKSNIQMFYSDSAGVSACPGLVMTPCSVISIFIKD